MIVKCPSPREREKARKAVLWSREYLSGETTSTPDPEAMSEVELERTNAWKAWMSEKLGATT